MIVIQRLASALDGYLLKDAYAEDVLAAVHSAEVGAWSGAQVQARLSSRLPRLPREQTPSRRSTHGTSRSSS